MHLQRSLQLLWHYNFVCFLFVFYVFSLSLKRNKYFQHFGSVLCFFSVFQFFCDGTRKQSNNEHERSKRSKCICRDLHSYFGITKILQLGMFLACNNQHISRDVDLCSYFRIAIILHLSCFLFFVFSFQFAFGCNETSKRPKSICRDLWNYNN